MMMLIFRSRLRGLTLLVAAGLLAPGCGDLPDSTMPKVATPAAKTDTGAAYQCKPPVEAEPLEDPDVTVSIANPPMVRLRDLATGMVKYYRAGVGVLKNGVSRSWEPVTFAGTQSFKLRPQNPEAGCRTREWINPKDLDDRAPLYAGLPWMPFRSYYAIHGPIDRYWDSKGGQLDPGYVSHGCIRMGSYEIRELYAHIKHKTSVPLYLTKTSFGQAAEREAYHSGWVMDSCAEDYDCRRIGGGHYCRKESASDAVGFCTKPCGRYCPDQLKRPMTFCVADPQDSTKGYCVNRASAADECSVGYTGLAFDEGVSRFSNADYEPQSVCRPAFDLANDSD